MNKKRLEMFVLGTVPEIKQSYRVQWVVVRVRFVNHADFYMGMTGRFPIPYVTLYVDYQCRKFGKRAIKGILAHEFAHYFTANERKADLLALKAGFKESLIAFHKAHNEKYEEYDAEEGMTLKEIESWARLT